MLAEELWKVTGYRFTLVITSEHHVKKTNQFGSVHDNRPLNGGHTTRFWCSQDEARKKAPKPSEQPNAKHRDHVGMKRYPCRSALLVKYKRNKKGGQDIFIRLQHHVSHVLYSDVRMPPEALQIIQEQAEWSTPSAMAAKIQVTYPHVTTNQIHAAWRELSETFWRREDAQLPSAKTLLAEFSDDVDIFEPVGVPEGVEMLAWGMKRIAEPLRGKVVEIGIDATLAEFTFIKHDFIPPGTGVDVDDYEGGIPDSELPPVVNDEAPAAQSAAPLTAPTAASPPSPAAPIPTAQPSGPAPSNGPSQHQPLPPLADVTNFLRIKLPLPHIASAIGRVIQGQGFRLSIPAAHLPTIEEQEEGVELSRSADNEREASINSSADEEDDDEEAGTYQHDGQTFEEALMDEIKLIEEFTAGLKHQAQFRDGRLLNTLQREGAGFLRFAKACMEKERRLNSTRSPTVSTWEKSTSSAMFYRARPTVDRST
ncbi:hypothetical protein CPB84DRAFT_1749343 [Gymnopilus junonius]|uniref:Uncharacterized protein n=1 Tax=Gymnopilus junonius TaxID=109634 RepID=A0A9P5NG69_GYMJU|nr:hypothetical protein CPB84DRAFT_1749343 [Gymnopilus junonius]